MFAFPLYMPVLALGLDAMFPDAAAQRDDGGNRGMAQSRLYGRR